MPREGVVATIRVSGGRGGGMEAGEGGMVRFWGGKRRWWCLIMYVEKVDRGIF